MDTGRKVKTGFRTDRATTHKKLTASRIYMGRVGPPRKRVSYTLETDSERFWLTSGNQQSDFWNILHTVLDVGPLRTHINGNAILE